MDCRNGRRNMSSNLRMRGQERWGGGLEFFLPLPQDPFQSWKVGLQQFLNQRSRILQELRLQLSQFPLHFDQLNRSVSKGAVVVRERPSSVQVHQSCYFVGMARSHRAELLARDGMSNQNRAIQV